MKKRLVFLLVAAAILTTCLAANAEIHLGERPPESWQKLDTLRVRAIDVERTDAMLISCGGEHMLVDASTTYHADRVMRAMDEHGVTTLKYLFSTHSDDDHIGGFAPLINAEKYQLGEFLSPNKMGYKDKAGFHQLAMSAVRSKKVAYRQSEDLEELTLGNAGMTVLRCLKPWGRNARSACLHIRLGESSMLLTGDIDATTMQHFVDKYPGELLSADIMKAPHHGVITMPENFLKAVGMQFMFVTNTGEKVSFAEFDRQMAEKAPGLPMLYAGDGAVVMETDGQDWYIWQEENW